MKNIYYRVYANDDAQQSGNFKTLKEALEEMNNLIDEDITELGVHEMDYYIIKFTETEDGIEEKEIRYEEDIEDDNKH